MQIDETYNHVNVPLPDLQFRSFIKTQLSRWNIIQIFIILLGTWSDQSQSERNGRRSRKIKRYAERNWRIFESKHESNKCRYWPDCKVWKLGEKVLVKNQNIGCTKFSIGSTYGNHQLWAYSTFQCVIFVYHHQFHCELIFLRLSIERWVPIKSQILCLDVL